MSALSNVKFVFQYLTGLGVRPCEHAASVEFTTTDKRACGPCQEIDSGWVHLRMCTSCGLSVCCDSSKYKHALNHVRETGHPITVSIEPGESWQWCYPHNGLVARKSS